jgi:hypothetical protein
LIQEKSRVRTGIPVATVEIVKNTDAKERLKEEKAQKSKARQAERAKKISAMEEHDR